MKPQPEQPHGNTIIPQQVQPPTLTELAKIRIMSRCGITEQEWATYDAELSIGLITLRTAFPTQSRNYTDREHDMLTALWLEIFVGIEPGIFHEAIMRFVADDRKGFFPSPGQIMGIVLDIQAERERQAADERMAEHAAYLQKIQERIDNGENCSTCRFCEHKEVPPKWNSTETEIRLFCQNLESYKYVGHYGHGTAASILCEYYAKKQQQSG